jgi:hypothetical protein
MQSVMGGSGVSQLKRDIAAHQPARYSVVE